MDLHPQNYRRRSIRLKGYDYSQPGLYFITICCQNRACLFGVVLNGKMKLNDAGIMVQNEWLKLTERFNNIKLHQFVVMPNHFHAILEIVGATLVVAQNDINSSINVVAQNDINISQNMVAQNDNNISQNMFARNDINSSINVVARNDINISQNMVAQNNNNISQNTVAQNDINESKNTIDPNKNDVSNKPDNGVNTNDMGNKKIPIIHNNIHSDKEGQPQGIAPTTYAGKTVGEIIGAFQSIVTVNYIRGVKNSDWESFDGKLWQRNYYEHIIRNETSYLKISDYIINNPENWNDDALK